MSLHNIDFDTFDLAFELDGRLCVDVTLAKLLDHVLYIAAIKPQLAGDFQLRQVQAHQVKARDPCA